MSKFFYFAIIVIFTANCSSPQKSEINVNAAVNNAKNSEINAVVNKTIASSDNQSSINTAASPNANTVIRNFSISRDNDIRKQAKDKLGTKGGEPEPIAPNVASPKINAPDNSEITSGMNQKGQPFETRTFKNHPILVKIEKTGLDNSNVKVYLRNGKTVTLPENLADKFLNVPASDILKAIAVK